MVPFSDVYGPTQNKNKPITNDRLGGRQDLLQCQRSLNMNGMEFRIKRERGVDTKFRYTHVNQEEYTQVSRSPGN